MRRSAAVLLVLVLGATACSGGDDGAAGGSDGSGSATGGDQRARESLTRMFAGDHPAGEGVAEGRCFADRLLADVTPEELQEHGILDADLEPAAGHGSLPGDVATPWAEAQLECLSFYDASTRAQRAATKGRLDEAAYRACLEAAVDEDQAVAGTAAALQGDWDHRALAELGRAQSTCAEQATAPRD